MRFYWTHKWRKTAALYMASQNSICERCGRLAHVVHHRQYLTQDNIHLPEIAYGWENLEALCADCHNKEHKAGASVAEGLAFDEDGNIKPVTQ